MTHFFKILCLSGLIAGSASAQPVDQGRKNVPEFSPAWPNQTRAAAVDTAAPLRIERVVRSLDRPWGIEVLPDGSYLVTERSGALRRVADGVAGAPIANVPIVQARGQGGLLDVALAPDFEQSRTLFLSYAKPLTGGTAATAVARAVLSEDHTTLMDVRDIFVQTPAYANGAHFGSRIVPDGTFLYVTVGERSDARVRVFAQDRDKTYGKVVRIRQNGVSPDDNPFAGERGAAPQVWSYGHRNPQGADLHPQTGELWTLEHGPRGGDELNRIVRGANYGWPIVSYGREYRGPLIGIDQPRADGYTEPQYYWDPVIAPGGFKFYDGAMFPDWRGNVLAASLNPGGLVRLVLDGDRVIGEERLFGDLGRVRDVEIDRDGAVLLLTDDTDGAIMRITRGE